MCDGALVMVLEALGREAKRARQADEAVCERDQLKSSVHSVERDALFNLYKANDKERDVEERDRQLKQRDAHIEDLRKERELLGLQLRELSELRKLRPQLEQQVFEKAREVKAMEERLQTQAAQLTAHFAAKLGQARDAAMAELEANAKKLYALLPPPTDQRSLELHEVVDAMRLVVAKQLL